MSRPRKRRNCRELSADTVFKPRSIPLKDLELVRMALDELEAMRLCDLEYLDQEDAGRKMGISRGTIFRLLKSGRAKLLEAITENKALVIGEDNGSQESV
jgi:predicted DNA-binding protein (UPF0251 family)